MGITIQKALVPTFQRLTAMMKRPFNDQLRDMVVERITRFSM